MSTIIASCLVFMFLGFGESEDSRYSLVKGENGVVYRVDKKTGETMMIRGTTMRPVKAVNSTPAVANASTVVKQTEFRAMTPDELAKITGRASGSGNKFSGTIYNGNEKLVIRNVSIGVTHLESGTQTVDRVYKCVLPYYATGKPLSSFTFSVDMLRGVEPEGHRYNWYIAGAMCEK